MTKLSILCLPSLVAPSCLPETHIASYSMYRTVPVTPGMGDGDGDGDARQAVRSSFKLDSDRSGWVWSGARDKTTNHPRPFA